MLCSHAESHTGSHTGSHRSILKVQKVSNESDDDEFDEIGAAALEQYALTQHTTDTASTYSANTGIYLTNTILLTQVSIRYQSYQHRYQSY